MVIPCKKDEDEESETVADNNLIFEEAIQEIPEKEDGKQSKKKWGLQIPKHKKVVEREDCSKDNQRPILLKNRLIGIENCRNENEKLIFDLNLRPSEPTEENYSKIPVSEFGAAMLRGMGWNGPEEGDEKLKSKNGPIKYIPRPERLGLGASQVQDESELKRRKPIEQSLGLEITKDEEKNLKRLDQKRRPGPLELPQKHSNFIGMDDSVSKKIKLVVESGTRVIISEGEHSGLKGIVKSESRDKRHWIVELFINNQSIVIPKHQVKRFDPSKSDNIIKISDHLYADKSNILWVCAGLKVKIRSKSFMNGRFYNIKGIILDVQIDQTCTLKLLESSRDIVQQVPQKCLETCLPRAADPSRPTVKYLKNDKGTEYFQAPFRVLQFDDERGRAIIQADDDFEIIFETHYDDICEFLNP
jgi:hypothetical protein